MEKSVDRPQGRKSDRRHAVDQSGEKKIEAVAVE